MRTPTMRLANGRKGIQRESPRSGATGSVPCDEGQNRPLISPFGEEGASCVFDAYPGANTREKVEAYVKELGFTDADIEKFRKIMFE